MIERFRNGLKLVHASWGVLRADREMLVLPILSAIASVALIALVFVGMFMDDLDVLRAGGELAPPTLGEWIVLAIASYLVSFIAIFFQVAQVCAADERMSGGNPTLRSAISDAAGHASAIAPWALVSTVVSLVLRAIEERAGWIGRIAAGFLGLAWALITYLILPVLVLEGVSVRDAIVRSKELFTTTWGEAVSGELGMSLIGFVAILASLPLLLLIGGGGQPVMLLFAVILFVVWALVVSTVLGALNTVFRVAVYRYATEGQAPEGFEHIDLGNVFPPKGKRGLLGRS